MSYIDTNSRSTKVLSNEALQPLGRQPVLNGAYIGFVKDASDVQRNGRLRVWIPELGAAPSESKNWLTVNYCSPFAGATSVATISKANVEQFEGTQTSYGMWMIPPDIDNQVLVIFIGGDPSKGVWIGCLYNQFMNNMIPGMAADVNNYQYPGKVVPLAEYNKTDTKVTQPDRAIKPFEKTKFQGLGNQGLITDQARGTTSSSARRESPSQVFGIITPGPVIDENASPTNIRRKGGSSFIMDDGIGTEYVQLTTKSGAQIRLDETNGFVYLINRDGTAWVQMDQQGDIDIFGAASISMRAQYDINIRADRNVNIEAGQNIYMKAAKDTTTSTTTFTYDVNNIPNSATIPYYQYVGEGGGEGGNIVMQSLGNYHTTVGGNAFASVTGNSNSQVTGNLVVNSTGSLDFKSGANISLQATGSINMKADGGVLSQGSKFDITGPLTVSDLVQFNGMTLISGGLSAAGPVELGGSVETESPTEAGEAGEALPAEVKQLTEKINILADWQDPTSKFLRNSESFQTTISRLATYEPCPEHESFVYKGITGYVPVQTEAAKTYEGSGGAGNQAAASPEPNTNPGANNTDIPPTPASQSAVSKDFNMPAYECQLKIHEGIRYVSYIDSVGLPTGGIGHLLRSNELAKYTPVPKAITNEQVAQWFQQDAPVSIAGAQRLLGVDTWAKLSDIRKRACADLCYNLGEGKLAKFVRFIAAMKASDYNAAGQSLRDSKWFSQVARRGPNIIAMIVQNVDPNGCDVKFPPQ